MPLPMTLYILEGAEASQSGKNAMVAMEKNGNPHDSRTGIGGFEALTFARVEHVELIEKDKFEAFLERFEVWANES